SRFQLRVILGYPPLNHFSEFFGLRQNLRCFSFSGDKSVIVINHVPLSPTPVEVVAVRAGCFSECKLDDFKRNPVMPSAYHGIRHTQLPSSRPAVRHCRLLQNAGLLIHRLVTHLPDRDGSPTAACLSPVSTFCVAVPRYLQVTASRSR